jgi:hypothetical protein
MASRLACVALAGLSLLSQAAAQTWVGKSFPNQRSNANLYSKTSCNPLNGTCPADAALGATASFDFSSTVNANIWNMTAGPMTYGSGGAQFTVAERGQSPTIQSNLYIFFGTVSVFMRASTGQGIISSIVLESDDLDEVDWEIIGGNTTHVETNYFGKGNTNTTFPRAVYYPVSPSPQSEYHNYTTHWTSEKLEWYIDGKLVRTLLATDNAGFDYPQTPMNIRLGLCPQQRRY